MVIEASEMPDYLHECLALHSKLARLHFKRPQDLAAIERAVASIEGRRLRYEDIRSIIRSPDFSVGQDYWRWPSKTEIEEALGTEVFNL